MEGLAFWPRRVFKAGFLTFFGRGMLQGFVLLCPGSGIDCEFSLGLKAND